jgi:hypothetical protein
MHAWSARASIDTARNPGPPCPPVIKTSAQCALAQPSSAAASPARRRVAAASKSHRPPLPPPGSAGHAASRSTAALTNAGTPNLTASGRKEATQASATAASRAPSVAKAAQSTWHDSGRHTETCARHRPAAQTHHLPATHSSCAHLRALTREGRQRQRPGQAGVQRQHGVVQPPAVLADVRVQYEQLAAKIVGPRGPAQPRVQPASARGSSERVRCWHDCPSDQHACAEEDAAAGWVGPPKPWHAPTARRALGAAYRREAVRGRSRLREDGVGRHGDGQAVLAAVRRGDEVVAVAPVPPRLRCTSLDPRSCDVMLPAACAACDAASSVCGRAMRRLEAALGGCSGFGHAGRVRGGAARAAHLQQAGDAVMPQQHAAAPHERRGLQGCAGSQGRTTPPNPPAGKPTSPRTALPRPRASPPALPPHSAPHAEGDEQRQVVHQSKVGCEAGAARRHVEGVSCWRSRTPQLPRNPAPCHAWARKPPIARSAMHWLLQHAERMAAARQLGAGPSTFPRVTPPVAMKAQGAASSSATSSASSPGGSATSSSRHST